MLCRPLIKIKSGADGQSVHPGSQDWLWALSVWLWQDIIILFSLLSLIIIFILCSSLLCPAHLQYLHISSQLPRPRIKTASNTIIFTTVNRIFITVISQQDYVWLDILPTYQYLSLIAKSFSVKGKIPPKTYLQNYPFMKIREKLSLKWIILGWLKLVYNGRI